MKKIAISNDNWYYNWKTDEALFPASRSERGPAMREISHHYPALNQ
jgi:hypothetical protein